MAKFAVILWTRENGKKLEEEQVEALKTSCLISIQNEFEEGTQVFYKSKNSNIQWEGTIHSVHDKKASAMNVVTNLTSDSCSSSDETPSTKDRPAKPTFLGFSEQHETDEESDIQSNRENDSTEMKERENGPVKKKQKQDLKDKENKPVKKRQAKNSKPRLTASQKKQKCAANNVAATMAAAQFFNAVSPPKSPSLKATPSTDNSISFTLQCQTQRSDQVQDGARKTAAVAEQATPLTSDNSFQNISITSQHPTPTSDYNIQNVTRGTSTIIPQASPFASNTSFRNKSMTQQFQIQRSDSNTQDGVRWSPSVVEEVTPLSSSFGSVSATQQSLIQRSDDNVQNGARGTSAIVPQASLFAADNCLRNASITQQFQTQTSGYKAQDGAQRTPAVIDPPTPFTGDGSFGNTSLAVQFQPREANNRLQNGARRTPATIPQALPFDTDNSLGNASITQQFQTQRSDYHSQVRARTFTEWLQEPTSSTPNDKDTSIPDKSYPQKSYTSTPQSTSASFRSEREYRSHMEQLEGYGSDVSSLGSPSTSLGFAISSLHDSQISTIGTSSYGNQTDISLHTQIAVLRQRCADLEAKNKSLSSTVGELQKENAELRAKGSQNVNNSEIFPSPELLESFQRFSTLFNMTASSQTESRQRTDQRDDEGQGDEPRGDQQREGCQRSDESTNTQELWPNTGVCLPVATLLNIHQRAAKDASKLFHLLFKELFRKKELINSVPFGGKNGIPEGKRILDQNKVHALREYVLRCSQLKGWKPTTLELLNKAFGNKCTSANRGNKEFLKNPDAN